MFSQPLQRLGKSADRPRGALSFRARLILTTILITFLAVAGMGFYVFYRAQQTDLYLTQQLDTSVRQQAEASLQTTSAEQVDALNNFFASLRTVITNYGATSGAMLGSESLLNTGTYWDATKSLSRLPNGSWDNPDTDAVSVFIPASQELSSSLDSELNTLVQLNFYAPVLLKANPDTVAIYFGGLQGETLYYPNVNLASLVPPDFDVTQRPWFLNAAPAKDTSGVAVWSDPYLDAASNGLVITTSIPVYDASRNFRGVAAMDIQLNRITQIVSDIHVGNTGHAFLLGKNNQLIAMPAAAYADFGITSADYPLGNDLDQTLLSTKISPALSDVVGKMSQGKSGLDTVSIKGVENFIIYTPVPEVGYSLAIVVPSQELLAGATLAKAQIAQSTRNSLVIGGLLVAILLVLSVLASLAIGNRLMRPLRALTSAAEEITRGNLNVEAKVQERDEIGLLAATFNNMTSQMRNMIGTLEERVAVRTKALATSTEVSRKLSTILDRDKLVREVVEQLVSAFGYYYAHIYLFDQARENLIMVGGTGEAGRIMLARGHRLPRGRGLVGRAAETNAVVLVPDTSKEPGWLPNELLPETRAEIAVPISIGGEVLGVFDVQHNVVNGLTDDDAGLLQSLASQVAISLQNARSIEQSKSQAELESLINAIGQKIQVTTTIEDTLKVAVRELGLALKAERSSVQLNLHAGEDGRN